MKCNCGNGMPILKVTFKDNQEVNYYCKDCGNGIEVCEDEYQKVERIINNSDIEELLEIMNELKR